MGIGIGTSLRYSLCCLQFVTVRLIVLTSRVHFLGDLLSAVRQSITRACVNRWDRSLPLLPLRQATASSGGLRTSRFPVGLEVPSVGQQAGPRCSP